MKKTQQKQQSNTVQSAVNNAKDKLDSFKSEKAKEAEVKQDKTSDSKKTVNKDLSTLYLTKNAHLRSRRAFVLDRLCSNVYDKHALAEEVTLFFSQFQNVKRNLQAISAICNDLRQMYDAEVIVCQADSRIVVRNKDKTAYTHKARARSSSAAVESLL